MGKLFAVVVILIAIGSAIPIVLHWYPMAEDISTHGHLIDEQMADTMAEAGIAFLAAQFVLGFFVFRFADRKDPGKIRTFPGGAKVMVGAAVVLVGLEVLALGILGQRAWAGQYFTPPGADAMTIQTQAGQFAFYFRYPGPDGKLGPQHPDKIDEGNQNFFGLDPANDVDSRDDVVTAELGIPVNKEIRLLMHSKDVGHSFYVRELRVQQDFVPGLDLMVHFTATKPGKYEIVCTQLCGLGHYNMKAYLNVMSQADYDAWMKQKVSEQ
jgi:cytochrome c oxidase subunit 2